MYETPSDVFTATDLKRLIKSSTIEGSVTIRGEHLEELSGVRTVKGDLGIGNSSVRSLGQLREITGNFWISVHHVEPQLQSLGQLERVGGDVGLRYSRVRDLGDLQSVGGNLSLRDTPIQQLGMLSYVGGNLFLPKRLEGKLNLNKVTIKGKTKYWSDSKTAREYASNGEGRLIRSKLRAPYWEHTYCYSTSDLSSATPEQLAFYKYYRESFLNGVFVDTEGYSNYEFILLYDLLGLYENSNDLHRLQNQFESLARHYPRVQPYSARILYEIFMKNGEYEHAWEIKKSLGATLTDVYEFELRLGRRLLDHQLLTLLAGSLHLTSFGQKHLTEISPLSEIILKKFEEENGASFFEKFFGRDAPLKALQTETSPFAAFDQEKPLAQLKLFLRQAEDLYRESIGMPKIGEGWISETELFYEITKAFPQYEVVHHARPKWLGRQHLDIYLPDVNIGIEYQGEQHFTAIDIFGGEEGLLRTLERDETKRKKCLENQCVLIYVKQDDVLEDVIREIQRTLDVSYQKTR